MEGHGLFVTSLLVRMTFDYNYSRLSKRLTRPQRGEHADNEERPRENRPNAAEYQNAVTLLPIRR